MWNISFCCRVAKVTKDGLAPIEMVITVDGQRSFKRLSMKVNPDEFKKLISCKRDNYIKQFCDNERIKAYEVFRKLEMLGMPITPAIVKEGLTSGVSISYRLSNLLEDFNAIISKRVGVDLCLNVYKKYVRIMKYVVVFLDDKECRLITNGDMKRIVADMRAKYQNSTFANLWVIVKSFITYGINNNRIPNNNLFATIKVVKKPKKVEYLTMEELDRIRNTTYSTPFLQRVADFAILDDLQDFHVRTVYKKGVCVFHDGQVADFPKPVIPEYLDTKAHDTFHLPDLTAEDFAEDRRRGLIGMVSGQIVTEDRGYAEKVDVSKDILKMFYAGLFIQLIHCY